MSRPWLSERVHLRGCEGAFIVISIDETEQTVEVIPAMGEALRVRRVGFAELIGPEEVRRGGAGGGT